MADIKTRDAVKGTIKTIDKAAIASERMKAAYAKTKDKAEQGYYADESSATEYASDKVSYTAERVMRTPIDTEIQELQKVLENIPTDNDNLKGFDLDSIISTLNSLVDFSGSTISHDVINQFVYLVTPTSDTTFEWYVNLNGKPNVKATFTAEGRKKNCLIRLEEIERISSLHRKENESNAQLIKNPCLLTYLHRLLSRNSANKKLTQVAQANNL